VNPARIPERYRAEYLSHPSITPNRDPVLRAGAASGEGDALADAEGRDMLRVTRGDRESALMVPFWYVVPPPPSPPPHDGGGGDGGDGGGGSRSYLPPAYLQVGGLDPLRDEALLYERILREERGVRTRVDIYPGYGHYFWSNFPRLDMSRQFVEDTVEGVRWLLGQGAEA
jgi:hypothetical protein